MPAPDSPDSPTIPIRIFDTTLRDGEQSPGASLNLAEKLEIARMLDQLGVDVIEAGFPITSDGDFEAVSAIAREVHRPIICGLARSVPRDIERAGEAVKHAANGRVHVFCATSKIHREHKLRKAFDEIVKISVASIQQARGYVDDVEFSPEDASRTELNHLVDITAAAIEAGATTINLPDTVGYAVPEEYGAMFAHVRAQIPAIDRDGIILSSHTHNDLGFAVANAIAAIQNGARQVECTVNGIGERAGNVALEEFIMALRTRRDYFAGYSTQINTKKIYMASRMVSQLTGLVVQRNKAVIGQNAFAHESGIHQDGVIKNRETYEIMDPRDLGIPESKLVLGKHSGRNALNQRVEELGFTLDAEQLQMVYDRFKELTDKKKDVYDEDVEAIVDSILEQERELWKLVRWQVVAGNGAMPTATITLTDTAGTQRTLAATGDGPVDAIYSAIQQLTGVICTLEDFRTRSITGGKDAQGEVSVQLDHNGVKVRGRGLSTDTVEAATLAYLSAINRIRVAAGATS